MDQEPTIVLGTMRKSRWPLNSASMNSKQLSAARAPVAVRHHPGMECMMISLSRVTLLEELGVVGARRAAALKDRKTDSNNNSSSQVKHRRMLLQGRRTLADPARTIVAEVVAVIVDFTRMRGS